MSARTLTLAALSFYLAGFAMLPPASALAGDPGPVYRWVAYIPEDGITLFPLSADFIAEHARGDPFTWEELRQAAGQVCPADMHNVFATTHSYVTHGNWNIGKRADIREYVEEITSIPVFVSRHLEVGATYAVSVGPGAPALLKKINDKLQCGGWVVGGAISLVIRPDAGWPDHLQLQYLGSPRPSIAPFHQYREYGEFGGTVPFTIGPSGPRPFDSEDLYQSPDPRLLVILSFAVIVYYWFAGFAFLLGYLGHFGVNIHEYSYNFGTGRYIAANLRSGMWAACAVPVYLMEYFAAAFIVDYGKHFYYGRPLTSFDRWAPVYIGVTALILGGIYVLYRSKIKTKREHRVFLLAAVCALGYLLLVLWFEYWVLYFAVMGAMGAGLSAVYMHGILQAQDKRSKGKVSHVVYANRQKAKDMIILGRFAEYLLGLPLGNEGVLAIPEREIDSIQADTGRVLSSV
jgi:hypothetical protein